MFNCSLKKIREAKTIFKGIMAENVLAQLKDTNPDWINSRNSKQEIKKKILTSTHHCEKVQKNHRKNLKSRWREKKIPYTDETEGRRDREGERKACKLSQGQRGTYIIFRNMWNIYKNWSYNQNQTESLNCFQMTEIIEVLLWPQDRCQ